MSPRNRRFAWWWAAQVIYWVEAGLAFMFLPWTNYWEFNYLAQHWDWFRHFWTHGALRGGVSALGAAMFYAGLRQLLENPQEPGS